MQFCYKCGELVEENADRCKYCGAELALRKIKVTNPQIQNNHEPQKVKSGSVKGYYIATGIICGLILIMVLFLVISTKSESIPRSLDEKTTQSKTPTSENDVVETVHGAMNDAAKTVFGSDDGVSPGLVIDRVPASATDVDYASDYHYSEQTLSPLFSDIMQLGGYSMQEAVANATIMSPDEENRIGKQIEDSLKNTSFKGKLDLDTQVTAYVNALGHFLARKVKRKGINYEFHVLSCDQFNALSFAGGKIYIFTGLLKHISNEAQLAAVIAHEIEHEDLMHTIALYQVSSKILGTTSIHPIVSYMASFMKHPYSGRIEADADRKGLELAYSCGYSPFQTVKLWKHLAGDKRNTSEKRKDLFGILVDQAAKEMDNILQTHPNADKRWKLLENHTLKLLKAYPEKRFYVGEWNFINKIPMSQKIK